MVKTPTHATTRSRRQKTIGYSTTHRPAAHVAYRPHVSACFGSVSTPCHGRRASASYGALKLCEELHQVSQVLVQGAGDRPTTAQALTPLWPPIRHAAKPHH